jgi:hypothetical protein
MNITNDGAQTDYITYFTKQLPQDLAAMAALRDELALRQGALSAVEDSTKLREEAARTLASTKDECAALKTDTQAKNAEANAKKTRQDIREADLNAREVAAAKAAEDTQASLTSQALMLGKLETTLIAREGKLEEGLSVLAAGKADLDARVKLFQAKAAALTA